MLIFKLIGGGCILFSALILYVDIQRTQKVKIKQVESYMLLIEHIKNQIKSYMMPIDSILDECDIQLLKNCGINLPKGNMTLNDLIENSNLYIDEEIARHLHIFAKEFGTKYSVEQITSCDNCIRVLNKYLDEIKEKHHKDKKVKLALCLSVSFSICSID